METSTDDHAPTHARTHAHDHAHNCRALLDNQRGLLSAFVEIAEHAQSASRPSSVSLLSKSNSRRN